PSVLKRERRKRSHPPRAPLPPTSPPGEPDPGTKNTKSAYQFWAVFSISRILSTILMRNRPYSSSKETWRSPWQPCRPRPTVSTPPPRGRPRQGLRKKRAKKSASTFSKFLRMCPPRFIHSPHNGWLLLFISSEKTPGLSS